MNAKSAADGRRKKARVIGAGTPRRAFENSEEMMHENEHQAQGVSTLLRDLLDTIHEARIERARRRMLRHNDKVREAAREFTRLINARSPQRVARMEAERGLS
jgi:ATP-dependent protease ClpP protease subunit